MNLRKENGITIITLVITIIILLILSTTAIYSGAKLIELSQVATFTANMKIIQERVNVINEEIELEVADYTDVGKDIDTLEQSLIQKVNIAANGIDLTGFKYFDENELEKILIESMDMQVLINFDTKQIISINGIEKNGNIYYTVEDLENGGDK